MKKIVLQLAALLFVASVPSINNSFAQTQIDIGIKGGLSIPNLTSSSSNNAISSGYSSRLDADAAIHAEFHLAKRFSIQPQLEYSSQGGKKNGTQAFTIPDEMRQQFPPGEAPAFLYATYKSEARINYLMLPVLAKYHFDLKKRWSAYAAAGPFVSFLLNAKNITKGSSYIYLDNAQTQPVSSQPQSFDSKDNIRGDLHRFNAGICGHLGMNYMLKKGSVFIEAGGNFGLIDIQKNEANGKNKTGAAVINIGYQFILQHVKLPVIPRKQQEN
ncbi:hypothetical protein A3860_22715 [Niastella vici]|uniref:Outer membrane protein beta-barrel domain-containing protein n=1 Tax=Niastella vici TaxID=1703345 RepID=A0A1V9FZT7_9BACT|nr:porin family protein [Niastella vici]OQP63756.1 hypothetical protein A3860_22715 [Niastella vici]